MPLVISRRRAMASRNNVLCCRAVFSLIRIIIFKKQMVISNISNRADPGTILVIQDGKSINI